MMRRCNYTPFWINSQLILNRPRAVLFYWINSFLCKNHTTFQYQFKFIYYLSRIWLCILYINLKFWVWNYFSTILLKLIISFLITFSYSLKIIFLHCNGYILWIINNINYLWCIMKNVKYYCTYIKFLNTYGSDVYMLIQVHLALTFNKFNLFFNNQLIWWNMHIMNFKSKNTLIDSFNV